MRESGLPRWHFVLMKTIAEQCRTNPWPEIPDWTLIPECRCRTSAADYRKNIRCRTNFSPAFRYLHIIFQYYIARITPSAAVYRRAGCITFHYSTCSVDVHWVMGIPFTTTNNSFFKCRNVRLSGIQSVRYRNEQKFRCRHQFVTKIRGPSPVPECSGTGLRYKIRECRCRRHRPRCRCPAMMKTTVKWQIL